MPYLRITVLCILAAFSGSTLFSQNHGGYKALVLNESTMIPVSAASVIVDKDSSAFQSDSGGFVLIDSLAPGEYTLAIQAENYYFETRNIIIQNGSTTCDTIFLNRIVTNSDYFFDYIFFSERSSAFISSEANNKTINTIEQLLKNEQDLTIVIFGYSDKNECASADTTLAYQRATVVRDMLVMKTIDAKRLTIRTAAQSNDSPADQRAAGGPDFNYRVEFVIKKQ